MSFVKYNSIGQHSSQKFVNKIKKQNQSRNWLVQEKIHGANFSAWVRNDMRGKPIFYSSRNGFIPKDAKFYNYEVIAQQYEKQFRKVASELLGSYEHCRADYIAIFGELHGGSGADYARVAKGVFYSQKPRFMAFDIGVVYGEEIEYLTWDDAFLTCLGAGIPVVPTLFKGSLDDCLEYDPVFQSIISQEYGEEPPAENFAEGIVIRPNLSFNLKNGDRAIMKLKHDKFLEKQRTKKPKKDVELSERGNEILNNLSDYVLNENRIHAVISKETGEVDRRDTGRIMGKVFVDAMDDYIAEDNNHPTKEIEQVEWNAIQKTVKSQLAKMILDNV